MDVQQEVQISLTVLVTGLVVVFLMLIFLTLIIKGYGNAVHSIQSRHDQKQQQKQQQNALQLLKFEPVQAAEPTAEKPMLQLQTDEEGIPDEVLAVLTAAAFSVIPGGTVSSVRRSASPDVGRSLWKKAGLLENTRPF